MLGQGGGYANTADAAELGGRKIMLYFLFTYFSKPNMALEQLLQEHHLTFPAETNKTQTILQISDSEDFNTPSQDFRFFNAHFLWSRFITSKLLLNKRLKSALILVRTDKSLPQLKYAFTIP